MNLKIAHLGPPGTYAEQAAFFYLHWLKTNQGITLQKSFALCPYPTIAQSLEAVADKQAEIDGLNNMIKAYRDEIELIEKELSVTEIEEAFQLALHEKLKAEELDKKIDEAVVSPFYDKEKEE